ncbi:CLIP domain-containing serine protease B4-like [Battus philenor]|uniref:CLIP domain-containing serine protease B4-like n=1 Tax=Battus philenor TaxID=42288 RepID=UPI0035CFD10C
MWKLFGVWTYLVVLVFGSIQPSEPMIKMKCELYNKKCTLITECTTALDLVEARDDKKLRKNFCGFDERVPKVCCPVESPIVFNNDTETATSIFKTTTPTISNVSTPQPKINFDESLQEPIIPPVNNDKKPSITINGLPSTKICGLSGSGSDRIFGGTLAALDEFPWLVRIKSSKNKDVHRAIYSCGGTLITEQFVVSAAHCVINRVIWEVRLGEWDIETDKDCSEGYCSDPVVDLNVTQVIVHPAYDRINFKADISLLRLERAVNYTDFIRPVCLPITKYTASQDYVPGTSFTASGWGKTELSTLAVIKQKIELNTVPVDVCEKKLPKIKMINSETIICAGGAVGKDTCNGDSGGPLTKEITENFRTNWYLYGITSFGATVCGVTDIPSVYTRVVPYLDWIIETINK